MSATRLRLGVIGIEHLHLFEMVDGLIGVGAETVCHAAADGPLTAMYEGWRPESVRQSVDAVLADPSLDLVVLAGVPSERAGVALAALAAGRNVLSAKPAVTTLDDLDALDIAGAGPARWWVFFSERLCNRAVSEAIRLVHAGAIGEVVAVTGSAPHTLAPESRPDWFFDPSQSGGILTDLVSHQADQMAALVGHFVPTVLSATIENVATPQHPDFQDIGRVSLRTEIDGRVILSDHYVDWLSPAGLGTWGDVRLVITGTTGTLEVRSNVDVAGEPGPEHLILVDADSARRVDCSDVAIDWAERLRSDIALGTDTLVSHDHTIDACRVAIRAQRAAEVSRDW